MTDHRKRAPDREESPNIKYESTELWEQFTILEIGEEKGFLSQSMMRWHASYETNDEDHQQSDL